MIITTRQGYAKIPSLYYCWHRFEDRAGSRQQKIKSAAVQKTYVLAKLPIVRAGNASGLDRS